jgi:hypothetical protein
MVVPLSFISTVKVDPVGAVVTDARTSPRVIAHGIRKVTFAVPVVRSVVSSLHATPISMRELVPLLMAFSMSVQFWSTSERRSCLFSSLRFVKSNAILLF